MKKLLLFLLIISSVGYSQIGSDVTQVNIILAQAFSIEVLHDQVDLLVNTADKYENGVVNQLNNHIKITSTLPYQLQFSLNQDYTNGTNTIADNKVKVLLSEGLTDLNELELSKTLTSILPNNTSTISRFLNAKYTLEGGDHLLVPEGIYTATLTYSLIPQ